MPKKQKHFNSERSILAAMYKVKRHQNELLAEAEQHDLKAKALSLRSLSSPLGEQDEQELGWQKQQAAKARRSADRLESKVQQLIQTQAAFNTTPLFGDESVNLQS